MKARIQQTLVFGIFISLFTFSIQANAQQTTQSIDEIKLVKSKEAKEFESLVIENFDINEVDTTEGKHKTNVHFSVNEKGEIYNVNAKGDCKEIDKEIVKTINGLVYKFDNQMAANYQLPIYLIVER